MIMPRPMADWLVTRTRTKPARRSRSRASAAPGSSRTMSRVGKVMDVLDQGAVAVEEDGRSSVRLAAAIVPTAARSRRRRVGPRSRAS